MKRDALLMKRVISARDSLLTVLNISFHANREPLLQLLKQGNTVHYFDHHLTGEIPEEICNANSVYVEYNQLCPPYPDCIEQWQIDSQDTSNCP